MELEIERTLVASTAHIPYSTSTYLNDLDIFDVEYGYKVYVPEIDVIERIYGDHPELCSLLKLALVNSCRWLLLDQDGPVYDKLPQFNW